MPVQKYSKNLSDEEERTFSCDYYDYDKTEDTLSNPVPSISPQYKTPKPKPVKLTNGMKHRVTLSMGEFMKLSKIYVAALMDCNVEDISDVIFQDEANEYTIENINVGDTVKIHYDFKIPMTADNIKKSKERAEDALKDRKIELNL